MRLFCELYCITQSIAPSNKCRQEIYLYQFKYCTFINIFLLITYSLLNFKYYRVNFTVNHTNSIANNTKKRVTAKAITLFKINKIIYYLFRYSTWCYTSSVKFISLFFQKNLFKLTNKIQAATNTDNAVLASFVKCLMISFSQTVHRHSICTNQTSQCICFSST